ncbi:hypothetical protein CP8484711_1693A, partial [Chlamydia psittaci 84-8471/1]
MPRKPF